MKQYGPMCMYYIYTYRESTRETQDIGSVLCLVLNRSLYIMVDLWSTALMLC